MDILWDILTNGALMASIVAWTVAQALKVLLTLVIQKEFHPSRFFGLGGMPSSHAASVCALAMSLAIAKGFYSAEFAISLVLALVVMTDAMGVRRAAGKQAEVLNKMMHDMIEKGIMPTQEKLKELLGHTPFQVVIGALLGVLIAILVML